MSPSASATQSALCLTHSIIHHRSVAVPRRFASLLRFCRALKRRLSWPMLHEDLGTARVNAWRSYSNAWVLHQLSYCPCDLESPRRTPLPLWFRARHAEAGSTRLGGL